MTKLKTRKPTGLVPWPLILLEGGEKSGKSWAGAELSASDKVGQTYWLDLGEGAADEYAAIKGARYLVVEHDGTWNNIIASVTAVREEAQRAADAGEPPVVLVIDSMTAEWDMLKDWALLCARDSDKNKKKLEADPNAEIDISMNYWNDAAERHRRLMRLLMTFPGIAVVTARGKETAAVDAFGRPIPRKTDYRVEGHKTLAYDVSVWVRMSREHAPLVVGARSVHVGLRPGVDRPTPVQDFSLEWLVFDLLKCDPSSATSRQLTEMRADDRPAPPPEGWPTAEQANAAISCTESLEQLSKVRQELLTANAGGAFTKADTDQIKRWLELAEARIKNDAETTQAPVSAQTALALVGAA